MTSLFTFVSLPNAKGYMRVWISGSGWVLLTTDKRHFNLQLPNSPNLTEIDVCDRD